MVKRLIFRLAKAECLLIQYMDVSYWKHTAQLYQGLFKMSYSTTTAFLRSPHGLISGKRLLRSLIYIPPLCVC